MFQNLEQQTINSEVQMQAAIESQNKVTWLLLEMLNKTNNNIEALFKKEPVNMVMRQFREIVSDLMSEVLNPTLTCQLHFCDSKKSKLDKI